MYHVFLGSVCPLCRNNNGLVYAFGSCQVTQQQCFCYYALCLTHGDVRIMSTYLSVTSLSEPVKPTFFTVYIVILAIHVLLLRDIPAVSTGSN